MIKKRCWKKVFHQKVINLIKKCFLTQFRMRVFAAATDGEGGEKVHLPKICHTYPTNMKLGKIKPYLKKTQKLYESRETPFEFCWHQHFFIGNQQILLFQEIQISIAFWYIIPDPFDVFWAFKDFFDKHGYNFDDVSKIGSSRPS